MKTLKTLLLAFTLLFAACEESPPDTEPEPEAAEAADLNLTTYSFDKVSGRINGCSCFFASTEEDLRNNTYYFGNNYEGLGYISIDHEIRELRLVNSTREEDTFGDYNYLETYSDDHYTVVIDVNYEENLDHELWRNRTQMTITSKDGPVIILNLIGECGC